MVLLSARGVLALAQWDGASRRIEVRPADLPEFPSVDETWRVVGPGIVAASADGSRVAQLTEERQVILTDLQRAFETRWEGSSVRRSPLALR